MESKKLEFACCFCFESGVVEGDEPIEVAAAGQRDEREHVFYAHLECLRRALHPQIHLQIPFYQDDEQDEEEPDAPSHLPQASDDKRAAPPPDEAAGLNRLVHATAIPGMADEHRPIGIAL
jgi:hypothetical protein